MDVTLLAKLVQLLETGGGWALAVIEGYIIWRLVKKNDELQTILREKLLEVTRELVEVLTENNIVAQQQADTMTRFLDKQDQHRLLTNGNGKPG